MSLCAFVCAYVRECVYVRVSMLSWGCTCVCVCLHVCELACVFLRVFDFVRVCVRD